MDSWTGWALIVGAALVSFFSRAVFVLPGSHMRLPATAERALRYAPAAALMAIVVPDLAAAHGALSISIENPRLIAGLVAFGLAAGTRSILLTIAGGMAALILLR
ncbi:MAG TPA: AzlD domain-containing protein [Burkholderiales bacterium]|nr:AzlD domain-containing protein [Burkholderiales bacterium]